YWTFSFSAKPLPTAADLNRVGGKNPVITCPDKGHRLLGGIQLQSASSASHIERLAGAST
ncbi:MAG: hypothetical protein WAO08_36555, partial [Hyphomicrobiaceae bacterium]